MLKAMFAGLCLLAPTMVAAQKNEPNSTRKADSAFANSLLQNADQTIRLYLFLTPAVTSAYERGAFARDLFDEYRRGLDRARDALPRIRGDVEVMEPPTRLARHHSQFVGAITRVARTIDSMSTACSRQDDWCNKERAEALRAAQAARVEYLDARRRLSDVLEQEGLSLAPIREASDTTPIVRTKLP